MNTILPLFINLLLIYLIAQIKKRTQIIFPSTLLYNFLHLLPDIDVLKLHLAVGNASEIEKAELRGHEVLVID